MGSYSLRIKAMFLLWSTNSCVEGLPDLSDFVSYYSLLHSAYCLLTGQTLLLQSPCSDYSFCLEATQTFLPTASLIPLYSALCVFPQRSSPSSIYIYWIFIGCVYCLPSLTQKRGLQMQGPVLTIVSQPLRKVLGIQEAISMC